MLQRGECAGHRHETIRESWLAFLSVFSALGGQISGHCHWPGWLGIRFGASGVTGCYSIAISWSSSFVLFGSNSSEISVSSESSAISLSSAITFKALSKWHELDSKYVVVRDHPYLSTFLNLLWTTHYVSINAVLEVSKNSIVLTQPFLCWRDIWSMGTSMNDVRLFGSI